MRIRTYDAERELDHVRAADNDGAGRAQSRNGRRIVSRGRCVREDLRACSRDLAADIEQIFYRNRQPFYRRTHDADAAHPI